MRPSRSGSKTKTAIHQITYYSAQKSGLATRRALSKLVRGARLEPTQRERGVRAPARRQIKNDRAGPRSQA
eukprot:2899655-Pleurochrysis_carterae.AAC.1